MEKAITAILLLDNEIHSTPQYLRELINSTGNGKCLFFCLMIFLFLIPTSAWRCDSTAIPEQPAVFPFVPTVELKPYR